MASKVTKLKTTRARRTSTSKAKSAATAAVTEAEVATPEGRPQVRMREIIERIMDRSGMKKGEARAAVEAATAVIADAIERGEDLDLPDLGKLKLQRQNETPKAKVYHLRLIRKSKPAPATQALAEEDEGG